MLSLVDWFNITVVWSTICLFISQDFAALLGNHLSIHQCTEHDEPSTVGRILRGAAQEGCWACFKDAHLLDKSGAAAKAVLVNHVEAVLRAIRSSLDYCYLSDENEVCVNSQLFASVYGRHISEKSPNFVAVSASEPQNRLTSPPVTAGYDFTMEICIYPSSVFYNRQIFIARDKKEYRLFVRANNRIYKVSHS